MAEWWEAAPLAAGGGTPAATGSWWESAPLAPPETSFWQRFSGEKTGAPLIPSATPDQARLLPTRKAIGRDGTVVPEFDYQAGALGSLLRAISTPGDILLGNLPTPYGGSNAPAQPTPDVSQRAFETAGAMTPISPSYRAGARFGTVSPLGDAPGQPWWSSQNALFPGMRGNLTKPIIEAPTGRELSMAADEGHNAVRNSGWEIPSTALADTAKTATDQIRERFTPPQPGLPGSAPDTYAQINVMTNPNRSVTSVADLMNHRQALTDIMQKGGSDSVAARQVRDEVDKLLGNLKDAGARPIVDPMRPGVGPSMSLDDVTSTLAAARANTRSEMTANRLSGEMEPAVKGILPQIELQGQAKGGAYDAERAMRDRVVKFLESNKDVASLLPSERAALEEVARGTTGGNFLRDFGRAFGTPSPFGFGTSIGSGHLLGSYLGIPGLEAAVPVAGNAARRGSTALTRNALQDVEELIRRNSPFYQGLLADAPLSYSPGLLRDRAVIRAFGGSTGGLLGPPPKVPGYI